MKKTLSLLLIFILQTILAQDLHNISKQNAGSYPKNGKIIYKYPSGKIQILAHYKDDKPVDVWRFYYKNGQLKTTGTVNPHTWDKNYENILIQVNDFIYGKQGVWKTYHENGQLKSKKKYNNQGIIVESVQFDIDGNMISKFVHGRYMSYYKNGQFKEIDFGATTKYFDENGNEISKLKYRKLLDLIHGNSVVFDVINDEKRHFLSSIDVLFKNHNIKKTKKNITQFNKEASKIFHEIAYEINGKIADQYESLPQAELDRLIKLAITEDDYYKMLDKVRFSEFYQQISEQVKNKHFTRFKQIFEHLKANDQMLRLKFTVNHQTQKRISNNELKMFLITNNPKYSKINILNPNSLEISKPNDLNPKDIESVLIVYKGIEIPFFNKKTILEPFKNLPEEIKEIYYPFNDKTFSQKLFWKLSIITNLKNNKEAKEYYIKTYHKSDASDIPEGLFLIFTTDQTEYKIFPLK